MQWDREQLLQSIGLQRRHTAGEQILPAIGLFGAGILIGVGMALLLAPASGREARGYVAQQGRRLTKAVRRRAPGEFDRIETAAHKASEHLGNVPNGVSSMKS